MFKKIFSWRKYYDWLLFASIGIYFAAYYFTTYKEFSSFIYLFKTLYWLSLLIIVFLGIVILRTMKLDNAYNEGGGLYSWYDITIKQKGVEWLKNAFDKLLEKKLVSPEHRYVVVSPSANKGTYEKVLFEYLSKKGITNKFIITDLNLIDNHEENVINDAGEYIFIDQKNDAKNIKTILEKANEEKADIILDFEGCLWYTKEYNWHKKQKCIRLVIEVLDAYKNSLDDNGLVIVDDRKGPWYETIIREWMHFLRHLKFGARAHSTGSYLLRMYEKDKDFKEYIDSNFEVYPLEVANEYGKDMSVMVYKKK